MNLVSFALRRPISLLTMVIAVALVGFLAVDRMSRDIFPDLGVPVLYVAQPYGGMDPAQMEGFIVNYYEYHFLYITGIEHVESKSIQGVGLIKLQFHPGTNMAQATAETVAYVDRARAFMPTGTVPPFVMRFDGGSVPVGDLVFSSKTKTVAELQDAALFKVRPLFATLPGQAAARENGQQISVLNASSERDIDNVFTGLAQRDGALIVSTDPFFVSRFHQIVVLAAYHKIPTIYDRREFVAAGGLISYGTHLPDAYRQIGVYAGKIIAGAKPSDLPVMQPTKFELVINLKTAKTLGLSIPPGVLAIADEVIE